MDQVSGVTIYERDSNYMLSRNIVVAVGFMKPPNPWTSADTCVVCENFNPRCGTFTGPGQVGGLSVVTCAGSMFILYSGIPFQPTCSLLLYIFSCESSPISL